VSYWAWALVLWAGCAALFLAGWILLHAGQDQGPQGPMNWLDD